jgi:hypothetical protein
MAFDVRAFDVRAFDDTAIANPITDVPSLTFSVN